MKPAKKENKPSLGFHSACPIVLSLSGSNEHLLTSLKPDLQNAPFTADSGLGKTEEHLSHVPSQCASESSPVEPQTNESTFSSLK